jgi:hypothetical protein
VPSPIFQLHQVIFLFHSFSTRLLQKKNKRKKKSARIEEKTTTKKKEGEKEERERERIKTNKPIFIVIFVRVFENIPKCIF